MGRRHIAGLSEGVRNGLFDVRLAGVVDVMAERAGEAAELAEKLLGRRPAVYGSVNEAVKSIEFEAADICTEPSTHHRVAEPLLESGIGCLVEKPLSTTVRGCRKILDASRRGGTLLAVAENYRRDPANRLTKAIIERGELGDWMTCVQIVIGGGDAVLITPWRHSRTGGILIDLCCHYADIFYYFFGAPRTISAAAGLLRRIRFARSPEGDDVRRLEFRAEAEDFLDAVYNFGESRLCSLHANLAAAGEGLWRRLIHLEHGSIEVPMERTGLPVKISRPIDRDYLSLKPHTIFTGQRPAEPYRVTAGEAEEIYDAETRALFPGLLNGYEMDFWEADRKLIALELSDFFKSLEGGSEPETGGWEGTLAVAMIAAALESSLLGRSVSLEDVLELRVEAYQERLNREMGLISDK